MNKLSNSSQRTVTQTIDVKMSGLHPAQLVVWKDPHRFKVMPAGRRFGKTRFGVAGCTINALKGRRCWWVAPTYKTARIGWRSIRAHARMVPGAEISEGHLTVEFPTGGSVEVRSASDPDTLVGEGLDHVYIDEASFLPARAWFESLRPALADKKGSATFGFTPKGKNWIWKLYQKGLEPSPLWKSFHFTSYDNPFVPKEEIDQLKEDMPENIFRQEVLAEFLDDGGEVFRKVLSSTTAEKQLYPHPGHKYCFGVDWGKYNDFTVIIVIDMTLGEMAFMDRFNGIDYTLQIQRLKALYERFQPVQVVAERNSIGDPIIEQLGREGLHVSPFLTTNATKASIIDGLALAFERERLKILNIPVLVEELQSFGCERLESGLLRYRAPEGFQDDCVMSLALAWSAASAPIPSSRFLMEPDAPRRKRQELPSTITQQEVERLFLCGEEEDD